MSPNELDLVAIAAGEIQRIAADLDRVRTNRDRRIVAALEAGHSTREVADAAGMSHVQVLRIRKASE